MPNTTWVRPSAQRTPVHVDGLGGDELERRGHVGRVSDGPSVGSLTSRTLGRRSCPRWRPSNARSADMNARVVPRRAPGKRPGR